MASELTVDRTNAIYKIINGVYMHNKDDTNVVASICTLLIELSHYG